MTAAVLNQKLGDPIAKICTNGYTNPKDNHCAHFVSHMLGYGFGATCATMSAGKNPGASIRVQDVFAHCPKVGAWATRPKDVKVYLAFVTHKSNVNVDRKTMQNVPKKHIGICIEGTIWHYSNADNKVVSQTPEEFQKHYPGAGIELFWGTLPA